jgi:hypothetical protein
MPIQESQAPVKQALMANAMIGDQKTGPKRFWTNREIETVARIYPESGLDACVQALPGRSANSIYQQWLKIKPVPSNRRAKTESSPELDDIIRQVFIRPKVTKSDIKLFAKRIGRDYRWVVKRGNQLTNTAAVRFRQRDWSQAELDLLEQNAHLTDAVISRKLRQAGFSRSVIAVRVKGKRLSVDRSDPSTMSAHELSRLLGVDGKTVTAWIEKGFLKAGRRGTARTSQQGGDEHLIHVKDLWAFIVEHAHLIDLRKVERTWFIDFLAHKPK